MHILPPTLMFLIERYISTAHIYTRYLSIVFDMKYIIEMKMILFKMFKNRYIYIYIYREREIIMQSSKRYITIYNFVGDRVFYSSLGCYD